MRISVRRLAEEPITLEVEPTDTVHNVKKQIQTKAGIRIDLQRLMFADKQLKNSESLANCGIRDNSTLQLVLRATQSSNIIAGGYGLGNDIKELSFPYGIVVEDDQTVVIADWGNHRIIQYRAGAENGQVIAGGNGPGKQFNQLNWPTDVLIDKQTNNLIICDRGNKRIVQWSRRDGTTEGIILLKNIACWGLAMDNQRYLYISDTEKNEIRRYEIRQTEIKPADETPVAGGHGRGAGFHQFNHPTYICVDEHQSVYVSDTWNHRVMKWSKDAKEGMIVARGFPRGIFVDATETIYVADYGNHKIMRWAKGETEGTVVTNENGDSEGTNELNYPWHLFRTQNGQTYVADHLNHRVYRFPVPIIQ